MEQALQRYGLIKHVTDDAPSNVSGSKYYLVILDNFTHYLWIFPLKFKSDTFTTLSNLFAYVSNQFGRKVKAIQCDNGREFDNSSTRIFLLSNGTQLRMS
jgi:hypothetical protein